MKCKSIMGLNRVINSTSGLLKNTTKTVIGGQLLSFLYITCAVAQTSVSYNWKNVQILGGGFVSGIVYNPAAQNLVYARTDVGGAYRWDATNQVWVPISDFIGSSQSNYTGVLSIAADPNNANRVYMATGLYSQSWAGTGAVFASTDKGNTWTQSSLTIKLGGNEDGRNTGERLQVDPNLGSTLFLGSSTDGLWKSTNYGSTWSKVTSFPVSASPVASGGISFVLFDKSSGSSGSATPTIYVGVLTGTGNNLYKSINGGSTWTAVSGQPTGNMPHHAALASGTMYITYSNGPGPNNITTGALWKYTTSSGTWAQLSPPSGQGGYGGVSVANGNPNIVMVSTIDRWWPQDEIYRSTDGGSTWKALLTGATYSYTLAPYAASSTPHWIGDVEIDPFNSNNAWFVTGYGTYYSSNLNASGAVTWSFLDKGLEETVPLGLVSPPSGPPLVSAIGDIDGFKHDNLDVSPSAGRLSPQYGSNTSIDFAQSSATYMVRTYNNSSGNYGSYSTSSGSSWTAFGSYPSGTTGGGHIAVSADATALVWSSSGASTYYSTNNGASWSASSGIIAGLTPVADRVNANKFYAYDATNGYIYVSTNKGVSFSIQATGLPTVPSYQLYTCNISTVFGIEGEIWLTSPSGLYRSTNSGTSFTKITTAISAERVGFGKAASGQTHPAVYLFGNVNNITGFFCSNDNGATWVRINDDQHQFGSVNAIIGDPRTYGRTYIATNGRGIIYGDPATSSVLSRAVYEITARHSGKALEVAGSSTADAGNVDQYTYNGGNNQKWRVESLGGGYYKLTNINSGKVLDVAGASTANSANVDQYTYNSTATNQQWLITSTGDGYYRLIAKHSSKCLDVTGASTADGGNVIQYTCNTGNNQQWLFTLLSTNRLGIEDETSDPVPGQNISIYPNPAKEGQFTIEVSGNDANSEIQVNVANVAGQIVYQQTVGSKNKVCVNQSLLPGVYIVQVKNGQNVFIRKLIIE